MDVIDFEVEEINKLIERAIDNSKIITCSRSLIRIDIKQTQFRQLTVCLRFSANYPSERILVELKSRTLGEKLLTGLALLAEQKASDSLGKPQSLHVLKFIDNYLREHPLCIVYDEIAAIKSLLQRHNSDCGALKCSQKSSTVNFTASSGEYYYKAKFHISTAYPAECVQWPEHESNFPAPLVRYLDGQAREIARRCTEKPLRWSNSMTFVPKPSLLATVKFLIEACADFPKEICPVCERDCLPHHASNVEQNDTRDQYVERVYCGHIYHQGCLKRYMREPPFPNGGKTCPAKTCVTSTLADRADKAPAKCRQRPDADLQEHRCGIRISHDRWALNVKLAEARWAQQQARERELEEVVDFLQ